MLRRALVSICLLAAPLALAEVTEEFHKTLPLSPNGEFSVSNVNGRVTVTAWDRDEVEIRAVKSARTQSDLEDTRIDIDASSDSVSVETHLPKRRNSDASVSYEISAPRSARVEAKTVNGALHVRGSSGDLVAATVNGGVEISGVSGEVQAKTVNGPLSASFASLPESGEHRFSSVNGRVHVALPSSASGSFEAETVNGGIRTDFPLQVRKARFGPSSSMEGTLGSGGGDFEFETVNGSIRISNDGGVAQR